MKVHRVEVSGVDSAEVCPPGGTPVWGCSTPMTSCPAPRPWPTCWRSPISHAAQVGTLWALRTHMNILWFTLLEPEVLYRTTYLLSLFHPIALSLSLRLSLSVSLSLTHKHICTESGFSSVLLPVSHFSLSPSVSQFFFLFRSLSLSLLPCVCVCVCVCVQISTPVLLLLGGRDRRVSPHQGLELYRHLKSRGSPVRSDTHTHTSNTDHHG